uniref:Phosphohistidine phosphatase n=1 Tax=Candidatus Kentrum sp. DK TaxID=2126562 RepID=A0A450SWG9_9GAMM|nr:MAG: phosphohistidine phosphatase [Candidatus Kentron sp. DK]
MYDSRELLLLRHAKSDWGTQADSDFERPLSRRGARDAPRVGRWLKARNLAPDLVVSSPAARARRTAGAACGAMGIPEDRIVWEPRVYDAVPGTLLTVLGACVGVARVLLVGHNPGLESLLRYLCRSLPLPPDGKLLPTATLAHIAMPSDWQMLQPGSGHLVSLTRPAAMDTETTE